MRHFNRAHFARNEPLGGREKGKAVRSGISAWGRRMHQSREHIETTDSLTKAIETPGQHALGIAGGGTAILLASLTCDAIQVSADAKLL